MLLQVREEDDDENLLGEVLSPAHMAPTESIRELQQTVPSFREFIWCDGERFRRPAGTSCSLCEIGCITPPKKKKKNTTYLQLRTRVPYIHSMDFYLFCFFWKERGLGNINPPEPRQYINAIELELFTYCISCDHMMSSSIPPFTFKHHPRKSLILLTFPPTTKKTPRQLYNHVFFFRGGAGLNLYPRKVMASHNLGHPTDPTHVVIKPSHSLTDGSTHQLDQPVVLLWYCCLVQKFGRQPPGIFKTYINGYKWDKLPFPQLVSLPDFWTINVVF